MIFALLPSHSEETGDQWGYALLKFHRVQVTGPSLTPGPDYEAHPEAIAESSHVMGDSPLSA